MGIAEKLAEARKAAVASTGLVKSAAQQSASATPSQSSMTTGMQNSQTVLPRRALTPSKNPNAAMVKPIPKEGEVLFHSQKASLGFIIGNERHAFKFSWLCTSNPKVIKYLRDEKNAKHYGVSEYKEEAKKPEEKQ